VSSGVAVRRRVCDDFIANAGARYLGENMVQQSRWSLRWSSDAFVLLLLQALLVALVCIGVTRGIGVQPISAGASATLSGALWLYTTYVAATVACGFAIQVAEAGHGRV